jgi:hypothetical protein
MLDVLENPPKSICTITLRTVCVLAARSWRLEGGCWGECDTVCCICESVHYSLSIKQVANKITNFSTPVLNFF